MNGLKPFLEIGKIVATHGIKGEVRVEPWCDSPKFFCSFKTLYMDKNGSCAVKVKSSRPHKNIVIVSLDGIDTVEKAQSLRGKVLFMDRRDAKIADGSYFIQDLIGCRVLDFDNTEKCYGTLTQVSETGANDVWHITDENGKEYLIPAIKDVVAKTDILKRTVYIRPLRGIFDNED